MENDGKNPKMNMKDLFANAGEKAQFALGIVADKGKEGTAAAMERLDKARFDIEKKRLAPVFKEELETLVNNGLCYLRVVDFDKKRMDNEACEGSIGFEEKIKGQKVLHLYTKEADNMDLIFYPSLQETLYLQNPYDHRMFICIEDYFDYIKKAKVDELETIAHNLGAKYVKITYKQHKERFLSHQMKADLDNKKLKKLKKNQDKNLDIEINNNYREDEFSDIKVAAEVEFTGSDKPAMPKVVYFEYESDIQALINMRLNSETENNIKSKTYIFEYKQKHELSKQLAANIDTVIKGLKWDGNASVLSKVEAESRTILEYQVRF